MASQHHINHLVPTGSDAASSDTSHLGRLNDLDEFKVADGYPDIRGWDVRTSDGTAVGKVGDLIVDTTALRVRYLDVEVDRSAAPDATAAGGHTLLPIGNVQLDEKDDHVLVDGYTLEQIGALPRYAGQTITRDYERTLRTAHGRRGTLGAAAAATGAAIAGAAAPTDDAPTEYGHTDYDDQRLYAPRRAGAGAAAAGTRRITLAEEQLAVGTQQVSGGAVELRKTVETQHVTEQVATTRDEVTVERRPVTAGAPLDTTPLGEGELRIPVMEERLVVEKRLVPVEQIIVRKRAVTEQQTVEGDVRRERLAIDDSTARAAGLVSDAGTSAASSTTRANTDR